MKEKLALVTTPDYDDYIPQYLTFDLKLKWEKLDLTSPGLTWLRRQMEAAGKKPPALMYRNQIVEIGRNRFKALKALEDWGLVEKRSGIEDLWLDQGS